MAIASRKLLGATGLYEMILLTAPIIITITTQVIPLGIVSVNLGIGILKGIPTAVAETVIIEPAKKQNKIPFARLYPVTNFLPQIFSN